LLLPTFRLFDNDVVNAPFIPLFEFVGLEDPLFGPALVNIGNAENGNVEEPNDELNAANLVNNGDQNQGPGDLPEVPQGENEFIDPDPQVALMEVLGNDFNNQCLVM